MIPERTPGHYGSGRMGKTPQAASIDLLAPQRHLLKNHMSRGRPLESDHQHHNEKPGVITNRVHLERENSLQRMSHAFPCAVVIS